MKNNIILWNDVWDCHFNFIFIKKQCLCCKDLSMETCPVFTILSYIIEYKNLVKKKHSILLLQVKLYYVQPLGGQVTSEFWAFYSLILLLAHQFRVLVKFSFWRDWTSRKQHSYASNASRQTDPDVSKWRHRPAILCFLSYLRLF